MSLWGDSGCVPCRAAVFDDSVDFMSALWNGDMVR